jgi:hypothetical protein
MSKTPAKADEAEVLHVDRNRKHPPVDPEVRLPQQVRDAAARADALATGQPLAHAPQGNGAFPLSDAEIDEVLRSIGGQVKDPRLAKIIALARVGAQHIKARRRGARKPRGISATVTRRQGALLQAYLELPLNLQRRPTGTNTIRFLRKKIIQKLELEDEDDVVSEDTITKDIQQIRSSSALMTLIRSGIIPRTGSPKKQVELSDKTKQEMEVGKKAVAAAASAKVAQSPSNRPARTSPNNFEK